MSIVVAGIVCAAASFVGYQLGLFDRPHFVFEQSLVTSNEKQTYLYAIVALSTEKSISRHIKRLMTGVKDGISKTIPDHEVQLIAAARLFGGSDAIDRTLSVALYFDNPNKEAKPRWASGWAVQGPNLSDDSYYEQLQKYVTDIQDNSGLTESIRVLRLG
jgi:hypothetical protein